jgi:amino acid adenylation domain-containing protein
LVSSRARAFLPDPTLPLEPTWPGAVHELFAQQAKRTPDQTAIVDSQRTWSYLELDRRSNQLARHLQTKGIRPGEVVAVYGGRSARLVCALLGVLKAGAAFMILDPANPDSYLDECLRVGKPRCSLQLDEIDALPESDDEIHLDVCANDLAYIAFTSGSTGTPKGIAGEHGPLAHFVEWHAQTFALNAGDRFSMLSGLSHDPLLRDIFTPLSVGATLCIPETVAGGRLGDWIVQQQITAMHLTPPTLQLLLDETSPCLPDLRYAFFGGDTLTMHDVSQLRGFAPQVECVNFYGATETPQAMGFFVVTPAHESLNLVPLGPGIDGVQLLVLNRAGEIAGVSEAGEICIRTPYLSRGYVDNEELTAARFVADSFGGASAVRIYRTGDRGRYLPDGNVEFLGRMDREIKVLGHRVDPEAIEVVLRSNTSVRDAVVVARGDGIGDKSLVAYVVSDTETERSASELRTYLRDKLPPYMIPAAFAQLDALPLTPNGKVDINALPVPDRNERETSFVASRTPIEEVLCGIWSDLLARPQIGVHDNFFDLGGHSLLATQVIARVRRAFHVELPLRRLFERPTVASLAETIDESVRVKADLAVPAIEPALRDAPLPLSFAQERLWFLQQLQPESFAYNMPAWIDLSGPLNIDALDQAITEIVRRHEILRTSFAVSGGQPVQIVDEAPRSMLMTVDLSGLENPEAQAQALSRAQARRPFDLARGPLLRGIVLRWDDEHHSLLLSMHHIAADAWSTTIFIQEVGALYSSLLKGEQSQLPELAIQYVDFAAWQRSWLQGEVLDTQLAYWKEQLRNSPPMLELPTDRPRPPVQTFRGETATLNVPEELTSRLVALSRRNGATLFMTLMAVFKTLLYRYTGSEDIVVGTGIAERKSVELERMIGLFINQLAIRTQLSAQQTFVELLETVRDRSLGAYAHQDLPFEKLVAELQPERSLSHTPLFQVMLMMQTAPRGRASLTDVKARLRAKAAGGAKFDLIMHVVPTGSDLRIALEYNTILFDADRVDRLLGHFHSLLEDVARRPEQRLGDLELLTAAERSQLLVDWNSTDAPHRRDVCIHHLIEAQTEQTPDRIAIEFEGATLTYRELNSRANQLAHYLQALNVGPDVMVGVCLERSLEMIVAMLGTFKAGGAYVPLDPAYPAERIEFMLDDTQAPVLLTQERVAADKELAKRDAHLVCLDRDWNRIAQESGENVLNDHDPDTLAYVIYTSGSTGRPKGVAIQHSSAVALIAWANDVFTPEDFKGVLASTSICFDLSIFEIFAPLSSGGRVFLVADALRLPALKSAAAVTLLNTVPSAAAELLRCGGLPKTIQTVNLAGEPLSTSLVRQLYDLGIKQVFDLYGPSEDTTYSTFALRAGTGQATIGRPVSNTKAFVLDKNLQPVPVGVPGELYLGGEGLTRGYLNRPELTATRFIPNPFNAGRLYKTGDLVRYLPDGRLEYLGRTDHQIKLRGFRIELGEVEAVLRQHPQISDNIVLVREDEPGDRRLVAYLVTGEEIPIGDLRAFLRKKLPDYMVPSAFVRLDALPLTANGKVDRKALPQPEDPTSRARNNYVAPRAELERSLVTIWQQLLRVETVGVEDNFFDLGGHSLLLVRLSQEIQNSLGLEVALVEMFEHPTVASLARHLSSKQSAVPAQPTTPAHATVVDESARRRRRSKRLQASNQVIATN